MATTDQEHQSTEQPADLPDPEEHLPELVIYSRSPFFYWWPVWLTGFIMALVSYLSDHRVEITESNIQYMTQGAAPGLIYSCVLFLVVVFTNVTVRGKASIIVILSVVVITLLITLAEWWEQILSFIPHINIHMNVGFYLFTSILFLIMWLFSFFIYDRLTYWRIRPGQITKEYIIGGGEDAYDTRGLVFNKHKEDFFRHWILGLGSGDLTLNTSGAKQAEMYIPNVLFVDAKVRQIQKLIAVKPDDMMEDKD